MNGSDGITGYDRAASQTLFGVAGSGDLFPSDTAAATHFTDPSRGNYSIRPASPCAQIAGVGLLDPTLFVR